MPDLSYPAVRVRVVMVLIYVLCIPFSMADTITLVASRDTTMYSEGELSNGVGHSTFIGRTNGGALRRALIAFDLSVVPRDATIDTVTLRMFMSRTRSGDQPLRIHRLSSPWGEGASNAGGNEGRGTPALPGDATWTHRFVPGQAWTNPGGDFASSVSYSGVVGSATDVYSWSSVDLAADVRGWIADASSNHGWILIGGEATNGSAKRFESRETDTPDYAPTLTVEYTPPGGPTGACCFGQTCVRTNQSTCEAQGGVYSGNNTVCTPNPCLPPSGACCLQEGGCIILTAAECASMHGDYAGDATDCTPGRCSPILTPFVDALPRPGIAQPTTGLPGGEALYDMVIFQFRDKLHRDLPFTTLWGYNGEFPGPTIEASADQPVTVFWVNNLRDESGELLTEHALHVDDCVHGPDHHGDVPRTVTHLHGARTGEESDGYPEWTQMPGEGSDAYVYPNRQRAATMWYHDHALGITRLNVYMGLAGLYILRDPAESSLNLPAGEHEIPLVIQDRSFKPDGSLRYPHHWHEHFFGDTILVNGRVWPYAEVKRGKYRLRLLNGSGSRTYQLSLANGTTFTQIGSDHGLLGSPVTRTNIQLSPGERADVIVDFARFLPGEEVVLLNSAPAPFPGPPGAGVVPNVMKFVIGTEAGHTAPVPAVLSTIARLQETDAGSHRTFELDVAADDCTGDKWLINGLGWDDLTEYPYVGSTEVWSFVNRSGVSHPMHLHHSPFQLLDRQNFVIQDGRVVPIGQRIPPGPHELGWKDTIRADPNQITRIIVRFEEFTGLYTYHCHILEHEDNEMMRQMRIVPCPADFNQDGGADGADVEAFYLVWVTGESQADLNFDGGVDGADVEVFFVKWEAGGC